MTGALANVTQIFNLSPQVSALAGGYLAALEAARQEAQVEVSRRLRETLAQMALPLEEERAVAATEAEDRRGRLGRRSPSPAGGTARRPPAVSGAEAAPGPFEARPVVDVRV